MFCSTWRKKINQRVTGQNFDCLSYTNYRALLHLNQSDHSLQTVIFFHNRTLLNISFWLNVDKFLYVLIRSAQTKHKTFINIKTQHFIFRLRALPRSSTNQSTGKRRGFFLTNCTRYKTFMKNLLYLTRNVNNIAFKG